MVGALFYCLKVGLQERVVRVEGTLDGPMYVGGPNHLLYLTQLEYKTIYRQMLALQRTTASTWGATMPKARHIYQAVVRSALSYGAAL